MRSFSDYSEEEIAAYKLGFLHALESAKRSSPEECAERLEYLRIGWGITDEVQE